MTIDATVEVSAKCDPAILRLGLINVLDNAIKYTLPRGTIRVVVRETSSGEPVIEVGGYRVGHSFGASRPNFRALLPC